MALATLTKYVGGTDKKTAPALVSATAAYAVGVAVRQVYNFWVNGKYAAAIPGGNLIMVLALDALSTLMIHYGLPAIGGAISGSAGFAFGFSGITATANANPDVLEIDDGAIDAISKLVADPFNEQLNTGDFRGADGRKVQVNAKSLADLLRSKVKSGELQAVA